MKCLADTLNEEHDKNNRESFNYMGLFLICTKFSITSDLGLSISDFSSLQSDNMMSVSRRDKFRSGMNDTHCNEVQAR